MENKQWKNELLLETLRSKSSKTFIEIAKNSRLNLLERRYNIDAVEKQTLQQALDNLQNNIQIKNRSHLVERLESITRRSLLKFTDNANTSSLFISSDMFYLEILLDPLSGKVNDVKVHHECSSNSESDIHLVEVLRKADFIDFTQHLEGFQSIYQLNAESKIKSKAFISIQALESDISNIYNFESLSNAPSEALVLKSLTGMVTKRKGGHAMKLLYFVRPTELLNFEKKRLDPLNNALQAAAIAKKNLGNSVTINLEAAAPSNKLQIAPLLIKNGKPDGGFSYSQINQNNSLLLPAVFVLRLNQGMPTSSAIVDEIKKITNNLGVYSEETVVFKTENGGEPKVTSLLNLIINQESESTYENGQKGLFVTLADQSHCYFISDNNEATGTVVKTIQFTEPSHVTQIIKLLRQQSLFNAIIASCVRKQSSRQDLDSFMIEVNVVSQQLIQIFVQHPFKEKIFTVEFDLRDIMHLSCKICESDKQFDAKLENYISRVFQKTFSVPMVLRSLIKCWDTEAQDYQRVEKRLNNSEIFGSTSESKSDTKDSKEDCKRSERNDTTGDNFVSSRQDPSDVYDICGINKNEIFLKANDPKIDFFDQRVNKSSRVLGFDMDDVADDMMSKRSSATEDLLMETSLSPASNLSSESLAKKSSVFASKAGTPTQKLLDVFDFNDPSPPPASTTIVPMQSPAGEARKIPTPRASPSSTGLDKRPRDIDILALKNQIGSGDGSMIGHCSVSITPVTATSEFVYEKPKSEKKKKRKREEGEGAPSLTKKKSGDSLGSSPSKKSSSQLLGKPSASFKPKKSPVGVDSIDDLSFLNYGVDQQQTVTLPSPLRSPSLKSSMQPQINRKNSLSAVINKLKSEQTMTPGEGNKSGEYQIKSSHSDGIKITFNKTKLSKGLKSPKHTGLKPGVNRNGCASGPASKKSSGSGKSSSQKLLYSKSQSSGSLGSSSSTAPQTFKSSSQPGKSSSKEKSSDGNQFAGFSGNSNDMLKNMLSIASPDIMKSFDRKFQIPKFSNRKVEDKTSTDDTQTFNSMHPRSAPSTPVQSSSPSPTSLDFMRDASSGVQQQQMTHPRFLPHQQHNKFFDQSRSKSSEQLFGDPNEKLSAGNRGNTAEISDADFQAFLKAQSRKSEPSNFMKSPMCMDGNMNQAGDGSSMAGSFNENDLIDLNFGSDL